MRAPRAETHPATHGQPPQPIPVSRYIRVGNHDRLQMEAAVSKIPAGWEECECSNGTAKRLPWLTGPEHSSQPPMLLSLQKLMTVHLLRPLVCTARSST